MSDHTDSFDDTFLFDDSIISAIEDPDVHVSKLKVALENGEFLDTVTTREILDQCFSNCSHESLDDKIFSGILPIAYRQLLQLLKGIGESLGGSPSDTISRVKNKLCGCIDLLDIWQKCLEQVTILKKVPAKFIRSLLDTLPETLEVIFKHCKTSKEEYGVFLEGLITELKNLFLKANSILRQFLATLKGVIVFDTDVQSETAILAKVIRHLGAVAVSTNGIDLRTFVEVTNAFGRLAIIHQDKITENSPIDVTANLEELITDISRMVSMFHIPSAKIEEKLVRACSMTLKVINKICENYCQFLSNKILRSYVELLTRIHRCSPSALKLLGFDEKMINLINVQISNGADAMLNTALKCSEFMQVYFEYGRQSEKDRIGFYLLTLSILKKLIASPYEQHSKWIFGSNCILEILFACVNDLQEEFCAGELMVKASHELGERPRLAGLYEASLLPVCGLVSQIPPEKFASLERFLLKHLLSGEFWESLLAADVWCFIGRLGSSELCYQHVKYLMKVHLLLEKRRNCFQLIMLSSLIKRLYALLPEGVKNTIVDDLQDNDIKIWLPLCKSLPAKAKCVLRERYQVKSNELGKVLNDLYQQPSVKTWTCLVMTVIKMNLLLETVDKETLDSMSKIWKSVVKAIENCEGNLQILMSDFIVILLSATRLCNFRDDIFSSVLESITTSSLYVAAHAKPPLAYFLKENVEKISNCNEELSNMVAKLNYGLLDDEDFFVRQAALESFDVIVNTCADDELVRKLLTSASKKERINSFLTAYFSSTSFYKLQGFSNASSYVRFLANKISSQNSVHICRPNDESEPKDKLQKVAGESIKDIDSRVLQICDELTDILQRKPEISNNVLIKLRTILQQIS